MTHEQDVGAGLLGQMGGHTAVAVKHVVRGAGEGDGVQPVGNRLQHGLGMRHEQQVGEHASVLHTGERLHAVVR